MKYLLKYNAVQYDGTEESRDAIQAMVSDLVVNEDETISIMSGSCYIIVNETDWVVKFPMISCYVYSNADFTDMFEEAT